MTKNYFEVIRSGINTTYQDLGRKNLYHIGIPFSGAMDTRNFILANAIAGNNENTPVIFQTPKSSTKNGLIITSKKTYCDLLFNSDNQKFIQWVEAF